MRYCICCCLMLLAGCQSPQVHLFNRHLSAEQSAELQRAMERQGYEVQLNALPLPDDIQASTLMFSPMLRNYDDVTRLIGLLETGGYPIAGANILSNNNHSYTGDNIGVYLLPAGAERPASHGTIALVNEFSGKGCHRGDASLQLQANGRYRFELSVWDEQQQDYINKAHRGRWKKQENRLLIHTHDGKHLTFAIVDGARQTPEGKIRTLNLLAGPNNSGMDGCDFIIGLHL